MSSSKRGIKRKGLSALAQHRIKVCLIISCLPINGSLGYRLVTHAPVLVWIMKHPTRR